MDKVFQLRVGWFCIVAGQTFGTWPCKEYAIAGMQTEQRRYKKRLLSTPWTPTVTKRAP